MTIGTHIMCKSRKKYSTAQKMAAALECSEWHSKNKCIEYIVFGGQVLSLTPKNDQVFYQLLLKRK
jgi:hypothetical protein